MSDALARFRAGVELRRGEVRGRPRHHFYTAELIAIGLEHAEHRRRDGLVPADIARELGVHRETLVRWVRRKCGPAGAHRERVGRVRIVAERTRVPSGVVVTAGPLEIRGLSIEEVATLIREMS